MQLSYGLSTEYSNQPSQVKPDIADADQQIYAKYYVSQILQLGEEGIRDAWYKVCIVCYMVMYALTLRKLWVACLYCPECAAVHPTIQNLKPTQRCTLVKLCVDDRQPPAGIQESETDGWNTSAGACGT